MKRIPILFSTEMVRANLAGLKTMTRRTRGLKEINKDINRYRYDGLIHDGQYAIFYDLFTYSIVNVRNPYGNQGDILWVREAWMRIGNDKYEYKASASQQFNEEYDGHWKPSIHMPYDACRLFLERTTEIRCERLQDITEEDAEAEGVAPIEPLHPGRWRGPHHFAFHKLWKELHGADSWEVNPWVWVVGYRKTERPTSI